MRTKRRFLRASQLAVLLAGGLPWSFDADHPVRETIPTVGPERTHSANVGYASRKRAMRVTDPTDSPDTVGLGTAVGPRVPSTLRETVIVWGTVQNELGIIIEDETIEIYSPSVLKRYVAVSDIQGEFLFTGVEPASDYKLSVNPHGLYKRYYRNAVEISAQEVVVDIVLEPLRTGLLHGSIVNAQGEAIPGFDVTLLSLSGDRRKMNVRSDAIGQFALDGFPEGPFEAFSRRIAISPNVRELVVRVTGLKFNIDTDEKLTLVVDKGFHRLTGHVYDDYGQAIAGALVMLNWTYSRGETRSVVERKASTDALGAFAVEGLGENEYDVVVYGTGTESLRRSMNIADNSGSAIFYLDSEPFKRNQGNAN